MRRFTLAAAIVLSAAGLSAHATTLASHTGGTGTTGANDYVGQSFTVSGTGSYDDITFSFLKPSNTPFASGTGYLFSSAYTGTEAGLSTATAGLLGTASSAGGVYTFAPGLDLSSGMTYFFYENFQFPAGTIFGDTGASGATFAMSPSATFNGAGSTTDFTVQGMSATTVTPEPSSLVLLGTGVLGLIGAARRRFV